MSRRANATFTISKWDEQTWDGQPAQEVEGSKLTRAEIAYRYTGETEGESEQQYLMTYSEGSPTIFIGLERITGSLNGKSGSFVLQHEGSDAEGGVVANYQVVPGSGTGELAGLRGKGRMEIAGHAESYSLVLDYEFE